MRGKQDMSPTADTPLSYRLTDKFLSAAELSFYRALLDAVAGQAVICAKVNLSDVFFVSRSDENPQAARNKIDRKHVDFLLCERQTMRPLVGVELDDSSHARADRQARDEFVDRVFQAASLPLIHVPAQAAYGVNELANLISPHLGVPGATVPGPVASDPVPPSSATAQNAPLCPKCGVPMVVRTAGRGERQGEQFYGCVNYPNCREKAPIG
jgi:hypothetical protein